MCSRLVCLLFALTAIAAAAEESPLGLSYVGTSDLKLIYFDSLGYLAPHALRTFTNSLAWQRRMWGWAPSEPIAVLMTDFSDYGRAATWAAPRNTLFVEIEALSHAFETYPASERMYSLMNHELVHIAQTDVSSEEDRRWRRFFLGKIPAQSQH